MSAQTVAEESDPADATQTPRASALRWLPSPLAIGAAAIGGVMWAITVTKGVQDPDYFWHVTAGELIARTGAVPSTDPFSFTWLGQPWTPHEWLSELLIYWLSSGLGSVGALMVFGLFPVAILGVLAAMLSRQGVRPLAYALPATLGALVMVGYVTLRPQAISWLLLGVLVWFLLQARAEHPRRTLLLIPFFVLWANLHGVYVIGLGVVGLYTLFTLLGRTPMSPARGWMLAGLAGSIGAAMLTPAGPVGIFYPLRYVDAGDWGLANISEWQSPNFHEPAHLAFMGLIVALGLNGGRRSPGWLVALSWVGIGLGLLALRNAPIAAVFAVPSLALGLEDRFRARDAHRPARKPMPPGRALGRRWMELAAAAAIVIGSIAVLVPRSMGSAIDENIAERFPVAAVDYLVDTGQADTDVLAEYGWGGYVIWRLHDLGGRVFVDGRNDMYDQQVLDDYSAIRDADPGWEALAASYGVEAILVSPEAPITRGAAELAGWCEVFRTDTQVLLQAPPCWQLQTTSPLPQGCRPGLPFRPHRTNGQAAVPKPLLPWGGFGRLEISANGEAENGPDRTHLLR